ncbi:MAG: hypothetical protein IH956_03400 [Chloroflexi bacterium]|nr:hypothetical protein [Chloroflexota bacterium]
MPPRRGRSWLSFKDRRPIALVTAGPRSHAQSWELRQVLIDQGAEERLPALLESVSRMAAARGAKRVFLRLVRDDPAVNDARQSGFFPCFRETLFKGTPLRQTDGSRGSLRKKEARHDYDLFRLYNATTPADVRTTVGMTFDAWQASAERPRGRSTEYVLESSGQVVGWVRYVHRSSTGTLSAVFHPSAEEGTASAIEFALGRLSGASIVYCLVPEYQTALGRVLTDYRFDAVCEFETLVGSTVVRAEQKARTKVTVTST